MAAGLIEDDLLFEAYVRVNGLAARLEAGDAVLVKGSRSVGMEQVAEILAELEGAPEGESRSGSAPPGGSGGGAV